MNGMFFRHLTGVLGAATLVGSAGGLVALLAFGGSGLTSAQAPTALGGPAAAASPSTGTSSAPATQITEGPPPVVDGVQRTNVGSAHSPQIQQQLAGPPPTAPPPMDAGALGVDVADHQHPHGAAIDWSQVAAAGYKFAFVKATEGNYYVNPSPVPVRVALSVRLALPRVPIAGTVCRPGTAMSRIKSRFRLRGESEPTGHATAKGSPR
jgi:hypothetical protein